jgi:exonuclease III
MKVISWNVENAMRCLGSLPEIVEQLGSPDVLCLQELRIRSIDQSDIRRLVEAIPGYRCHYALARDPRNVTFRGGRMYGVATFLKGRWRADQPYWDREGRLVVVRRRKLAILNVYAVNGTANPYFDEAGQIVGNRHTFKRRFQQQVISLGRELQDLGGVIMAGDWNVSPTAQDTYPRLRIEAPHARARAEFNAQVAQAGFVDVWRQRHPFERVYAWFNRRARGLHGLTIFWFQKI